MKTVYLIRHGKRESHFEDTQLSVVGRKQAELTGSYFMDKNLDLLLASPMNRTQETAEIISKAVNLPIKTNQRLKERLIWGDRKGESFEEFIELWDKASQDRNYKPDYGDSSVIAGNRLREVIDEISDEKNILIVTHGGLINDLLMNLFTKDYSPILECSITELQVENGEYRLIKLKEIEHLPGPTT